MFSPKQQLADYLFSQREEIAEKLMVLGHPDRLAIVALLTNESQPFQYLEKQVKINKTTLSNHLQQLTSHQLIKKVRRGLYRIEETTSLLMEYLREYLVEDQKLRLQRLQKSYLQNLSEVKVMTMNTLDKEPKFQPSWITYAGAFAGVLQAMGENYDVVDILGYSGYGFLSNVSTKSTHIAAPTATEFFKEFDCGVASLGYRLDGFWDEGAIFGRQHLDADAISRLNKLFDYVKEQLDHNNPVILWGLGAAEFGIVTGYEEEHYKVSTFRMFADKQDPPIHYTALDAPGGLWGYSLGRKEKERDEKTDREAIERAIVISKGTSGTSLVGSPKKEWELEQMDYISGPKTFAKWAQNLENGEISQMGNSYVIACYNEGRTAVSMFFKRLFERYQGKSFARDLKALEEHYTIIASKLEVLHQMFPFHNGNDDPDVIKKAVKLLYETAPLEEKAIELMERLIDNWKL